MQQIYDESVCKLKGYGNLNNSMTHKNKSKPKRGVKTSYGNYAQVQNPILFHGGNKLKLHKARKSMMTTHNSK